MRYLPHRAFTVLLAGLALGLIFFVYGRIVGPLPVVETLGWTAIGFAIGAGFFLPLVLAGASGDKRYLMLSDANPEAFVVQTGADATLVDQLTTFEPWLTLEQAESVSATVVLDAAGAQFWLGVRHPVLYVSIPWADVTYLKLGQPRNSVVRRFGTEDQLLLTATRDDYVATLSFTVERTDAFRPDHPYLRAFELELIAEHAALYR